MRLLTPLSLACLLALAGTAQADVFINELHYDDSTPAGDVGEAIEVVATGGEDLSTYRLYLYNGSSPSAATVYANNPVPPAPPPRAARPPSPPSPTPPTASRTAPTTASPSSTPAAKSSSSSATKAPSPPAAARPPA